MLHLTAVGEMRADEIIRVLRRVRAHLLKVVSGEDLAVTFEALQRIEQRASRLQEAAAIVEAAQPRPSTTPFSSPTPISFFPSRPSPRPSCRRSPRIPRTYPPPLPLC